MVLSCFNARIILKVNFCDLHITMPHLTGKVKKIAPLFRIPLSKCVPKNVGTKLYVFKTAKTLYLLNNC